MKWATLLKDFKEKVGLSQPPSTVCSPTHAAASSFPESYPISASSHLDFASSPSRDKHELELDFKRFWEEFRSSSLEKEKEKALNMTIDIFCRLVRQHTNVAQLITMLVETHFFFCLKSVLEFFSEITKDGISPGANLLYAVEVLVSGPIDKQSLLDSGILCCLIHTLNSLLGPDESCQKQFMGHSTEEDLAENYPEDDAASRRRLEVEGSVVHIMKALSSHPSAAQSLIEDNSLQSLFQTVAMGSLIAFSQYKEGLVRLHTIQLHRHAMQILGLLLANDNGSTAKYIRKHHL
ncbi:unnamed protein product, partial [Cuscuta campestris]